MKKTKKKHPQLKVVNILDVTVQLGGDDVQQDRVMSLGHGFDCERWLLVFGSRGGGGSFGGCIVGSWRVE
jgi:hypothetical protein